MIQHSVIVATVLEKPNCGDKATSETDESNSEIQGSYLIMKMQALKLRFRIKTRLNQNEEWNMEDTGRDIKVLGFAGSLRKGSYNRAALRAAQELLPPGMTMETFYLGTIPLFNEDVEREGFPAAVLEFKERIAAADALLIATPEYNYSIPGVLKNAIDWASRPYGQSSFTGKPLAIMGASIGYFGSSRAQYHLRQVCVCLDMYPVNSPEVFISDAASKFDETGKLTAGMYRDGISNLLKALQKWTIRLRED
jgi:chromate reductase